MACGWRHFCFVLLFPVNIMSGLGISVWAWNQKTSSEITGITAGFFANIQYLMVDKPEGYSTTEVEQVSEEAQLEDPEPAGEPEQLPTIIAVMNESFTDTGRHQGQEHHPFAGQPLLPSLPAGIGRSDLGHGVLLGVWGQYLQQRV